MLQTTPVYCAMYKRLFVEFPQTAREVDVPIIGRDVCDRYYSHLHITHGMICAGTASEDACNVIAW